MKNKIRNITLGALLGLSGALSAEEIPFKQKVETVVRYLQQRPINPLTRNHSDDFITEKGWHSVSYGYISEAEGGRSQEIGRCVGKVSQITGNFTQSLYRKDTFLLLCKPLQFPKLNTND